MAQCHVYTTAQLDSIRRAGKILRDCLQMLRGEVRPGVTTEELDAKAEEFIRAAGGIPAFKGYHGFPATICTSVNEECVHGIPGPRLLNDGDVISLDCGVIIDGLYTDACITVGVGAISAEAKKLLAVTERALENALALVRAGARVGDLSATIEETARAEGCSPVDALTGHGVGINLHMYPDIPNVGRRGTGATLPADTVIAIEPILALGKSRIYQGDDGWTITTADKSLAAHVEHTVRVTEDGYEMIA